MKKTLTINIDGIVFHINEDAYYKLSHYLDRVNAYFRRDKGGDEIISGIESRIAEIFRERKKGYSQVITIEDVDEVISQLGEPSQINGEEKESEKKEQKTTRNSSSYNSDESAPRRLFRDPDDKYIGGVCGGLAVYFNLDPTIIRLIFVILFLTGTSILLYLVLWIVIPKARTTSERLSMRGEKINLSSIEKAIREDIEDIKRNLQDLSKKI